MRLTANQNLILLDVEPAWKADIITTLGASCTCTVLPIVKASGSNQFVHFRARTQTCWSSDLSVIVGQRRRIIDVFLVPFQRRLGFVRPSRMFVSHACARQARRA